MWPFTKRKCYFFVYKVENFSKEEQLPKNLLIHIQKYMKRRFKKILYYEPFTSVNGTYVVIGSEKVDSKANRNVLIFSLELFASFKSETIEVSKDFPKQERKIKGHNVTIYKFKRFKI